MKVKRPLSPLNVNHTGRGVRKRCVDLCCFDLWMMLEKCHQVRVAALCGIGTRWYTHNKGGEILWSNCTLLLLWWWYFNWKYTGNSLLLSGLDRRAQQGSLKVPIMLPLNRSLSAFFSHKTYNNKSLTRWLIALLIYSPTKCLITLWVYILRTTFFAYTYEDLHDIYPVFGFAVSNRIFTFQFIQSPNPHRMQSFTSLGLEKPNNIIFFVNAVGLHCKLGATGFYSQPKMGLALLQVQFLFLTVFLWIPSLNVWHRWS